MDEPDFSDNESVGFPSDVSCNDYTDEEGDPTPEIEIDMDSSIPLSKNSNTQGKAATKAAAAAAAASMTQKSVITKKTIPTTPVNKIQSKAQTQVQSVSSSATKDKDKSKGNDKNNKASEKAKEKDNEEQEKAKEKESQESAADKKFEFNDETIEYFSKDILGHVKKICIPNSAFNNDTALLCLLIKLQIIKEYKCVEKKCKTGKTWLGKPIQLLIHRKNGKMHDLTTSNLELMCPNCYIARYGLDIFMKVIAKAIYKCSYCGYPLNNFTNSKKKEKICMACESRIMTSGYFQQRSQFIDQLSETIDEASTLKKDEFKSSNYYNQVSQFKSFESGSKPSARKTSSENSKTFNDKPIISLNLTVPSIEDLIIEE